MKRVIITGGSSGLGLSFTRALADLGYNIHMFALDSNEHWLEIAGELANKVAYTRVDLQQFNKARTALLKSADIMGGLDILINNAGVMNFENAHDAIAESISKQLDINLEAPIHLCSVALGIMLKQGIGGQIINIASVAGLKATPKLAVYAASKAGLIHYTRTIAAEYAAKKIRANVICPGAMETALTNRLMFAMIKKGIPLGEFQTPKEVASLVVWLMGNDANNVTGSVFSIDGGMSL